MTPSISDEEREELTVAVDAQMALARRSAKHRAVVPDDYEAELASVLEDAMVSVRLATLDKVVALLTARSAPEEGVASPTLSDLAAACETEMGPAVFAEFKADLADPSRLTPQEGPAARSSGQGGVDSPLQSKMDYRGAYADLSEYACQELGKALGYPWFKDDPKNFPDATEADGVCVGEHVAESIIEEAAARLLALSSEPIQAGWREKVARIIDPKSWEHVDRYRAPPGKHEDPDIVAQHQAGWRREADRLAAPSLAKADAILSQLPSGGGTPDGWRDISTAPANGEPVLVTRAPFVGRRAPTKIAWRFEGSADPRWRISFSKRLRYKPTHWMHLPAPPPTGRVDAGRPIADAVCPRCAGAGIRPTGIAGPCDECNGSGRITAVALDADAPHQAREEANQ